MEENENLQKTIINIQSILSNQNIEKMEIVPEDNEKNQNEERLDMKNTNEIIVRCTNSWDKFLEKLKREIQELGNCPIYTSISFGGACLFFFINLSVKFCFIYSQ